MSYLRYVALGDSQTEGLNDGDELSGYRGWADRLAEHLAAVTPEVTYANLAVRGRQARAVRAEQLGPALALRPDLATVMAGMNDLIRPGFDAAAVTAELEAMFAALTGAGARVLTFTFPDITRLMPIARRLRPRLVDFNDRIRAAAARHDVVLVDGFAHPLSVDKRLWSADRIHATTLGHTLIAASAAEALGLPAADATPASTPATTPASTAPATLPTTSPTVPPLATAARELVWLGTYAGPWAVRRLRGRSSGDGRAAKRPDLAPVVAPGPA
jgi:lysophospholipase L1-like esterase